MSFDTKIMEGLLAVLRRFDIFGMEGAYHPPGQLVERRNVFLTNVQIVQQSSNVTLKGTICCPEGGSAKQFQHGFFSHMKDREILGQECFVAWEGDFQPELTATTILQWNLHDAFHEETRWC